MDVRLRHRQARHRAQAREPGGRRHRGRPLQTRVPDRVQEVGPRRTSSLACPCAEGASCGCLRRRRRSPKALAVAALQRHQSGPSAPSLATALRCRTIEKACAGVVDGIDELAEYLLTAAREGKSVGTVAQRVCTKMAGVCKKGKTPAWPDSMVKVTPWQRASSAPAPPQGTPGCSGRLGTLRKRPAYCASSHCLGCSS